MRIKRKINVRQTYTIRGLCLIWNCSAAKTLPVARVFEGKAVMMLEENQLVQGPWGRDDFNRWDKWEVRVTEAL